MAAAPPESDCLPPAGVGAPPLYHAVPLHYLPTLLATGALYSQRRLRDRALPIDPRRTAYLRDRKLRLDHYVHLALTPITPLLTDKRRRGYPHALLEFAPALADFANAHALRYNPKAWRHRDDFAPIADLSGKTQFFADWRDGRYPSGELLIADELPLSPHCLALHLSTDAEMIWIQTLADALNLAPPFPLFTAPHLFPVAPGIDLTPHHLYAEACRATNSLLPPPDLPFD